MLKTNEIKCLTLFRIKLHQTYKWLCICTMSKISKMKWTEWITGLLLLRVLVFNCLFSGGSKPRTWNLNPDPDSRFRTTVSQPSTMYRTIALCTMYVKCTVQYRKSCLHSIMCKMCQFCRVEYNIKCTVFRVYVHFTIYSVQSHNWFVYNIQLKM